MPLFQRHDADLVRGLSPLRRILPYLMRTRNESAVYYEQQLDLTRTLPFLEAWNRDHTHALSVFDVVIAACGRALHARPGLNRFVAGGRIYQRRGVEVSFAVKKLFHDDAPLVTVKLALAEHEPLSETARRIHERLGEARGQRERGVDKEVRWVTAMPGVVLRGAVQLARWAIDWNVMPAAMTRDDPMFCSIFLANLGSVGLDHAYHHLYEYGTASLFGVVGVIKKVSSLQADGTTRIHDGVSVRWTFDERIHDGFYCAATLELMRKYAEDPALMLAGGVVIHGRRE